MQLSNADRKTIAVRIPKKYQFLVKAFVCWLKFYPDKMTLWNAETLMQSYYETLKISPTSSAATKAIADYTHKILGRLKP
jgi:hypothetical protein